MRYTKYILNGRFIDLESIQTNNILFKLPILGMSLVAGVIVLVILSSILPIAFLVDEYRTTKYHYIRFKRGGYKLV